MNDRTQMSAQNTGARKTETDFDHADKAYAWLKDNHPHVHDYIRNEAPVPIDPVQTRMAVQHMGADNALKMLKGHVSQDTRKVWQPVVGDRWTDLVRESVDIAEALDPDITWNRHGQKATPRMHEEGFHFEQEGSRKKFFISKLHEADPTSHKAYAPWLASRYASGGINKIEDFDRAHAALNKFHDAKTRKKLGDHGINADINQYKDLSSLETEVAKIPTEMSAKEKARITKDNETTKVDEKHWSVITPHTENASCLYGRGTTWCTAATASRNYFNHYNKDGPMHILIPKNPAYEGEKYQYHAHSNQFMNEQDKPVSAISVLRDRPSDTVYEHSADVVKNATGSKHAAASIILHHDFDKHRNDVMNSDAVRHDSVQGIIAERGSDEDIDKIIAARPRGPTDSIAAGLIRRDPAKWGKLGYVGHESTSAILSAPGGVHMMAKQAADKPADRIAKMYEHPHLTDEHKDILGHTLRNHEDPLIRATVASSSRIHAEHLKNDPHFLVAAMAQEKLGK